LGGHGWKPVGGQARYPSIRPALATGPRCLGASPLSWRWPSAFGGGTPPATGATEKYDGTSWTTTANLAQARGVLVGAGIQTAGLGFGGFTTVNTNATEEYDGSAWTAGGNLNTARSELAGCGLQTAGLAFGGMGSFEQATNDLNKVRLFSNYHVTYYHSVYVVWTECCWSLYNTYASRKYRRWNCWYGNRS
jgi:hypothetical protein